MGTLKERLAWLLFGDVIREAVMVERSECRRIVDRAIINNWPHGGKAVSDALVSVEDAIRQRTRDGL